MADESHDELMLIGRLAYADPEVVRKELQEYARRIQSDSLGYPTESLEEALFSRSEPNINFALAEYGGSTDVVRLLYELSGTESNDQAHALYLRALRVACLSNRSCAGILSRFPRPIVDESEQDRLIRSGSGDEIYALFTNPIISTDLLSQLFSGKGPFTDIEDERRCQLIAYASKNPRLNDDKSNEHGPDMGHWDIHKALLTMLVECPVNKKWFLVLEYLLGNVNPFMLRSPESSEQSKQIADKWREYTPDEDDSILQNGIYTELSYLDEFRIDIASRFGHYANKETEFRRIPIGSLDSDDLLERCAFYGSAHMSLKDMDKALAKDGSTFVYATLQDRSVYDSKDNRLFMEEHGLRGYMTNVYSRRCEQFKKIRTSFDPTPVSEWMRGSDDFSAGESDGAADKPQWAATLEGGLVELARSIHENKRANDSLKTYLVSILVIVGLIAVALFL